ncbi:hypothetical protein BV25DRAFT_957857 [Artomyces pyxidatus]|uniref:Uncharacterized protein n=1 Tax=Artomyces pyxidatus TaxID=48021 RepID=A0ACB8SX26_9AGAM|nr:hypothetical protein BV25DRAFT_957857 [Artomyces pyxidatus]
MGLVPSTSSRMYVDLIYGKTSKYANWDPAKRIQIGDYGIVDRETGAFEPEGNIYTDPAIKGELAEADKVIDGDPIQTYYVSTGRATSRQGHLEPEVSLPGVVEASIKGEWDFGNERGAALIMSNPRISSLPAPLLQRLAALPVLKNKRIVTEMYTCPAFFMYLSGKKQDHLKIELRALAPIAAAAGVTAGGGVGVGWRKEYRDGVVQDAFHPEGKYSYFPLFNLKKLREPSSRRESPEPESVANLLWVDAPVPWDILDEDGNEFVDVVSDSE